MKRLQTLAQSVLLTNRFSVLIAFAILGEDNANIYNRRRLVRLRVPSLDKMVVEVDLEREYLGHCWKLMLICGKIKQTMQGAARVTI